MILALTFALLVGVDAYDPDYIAPARWLDQCGTDVAYLDGSLVGDCGWSAENVTALVDAAATREAILDRLVRLAECAEPGDRVLFYQSSHGMRYPWGESYLCAYDADLTSEDLAAAFARFRPGVRLLAVVDACYAGGLYGEYAADDFATDVTTCLGWRNVAPVGWITSSAEDELSYELAEGPGAVFSRAWTFALSTGAADSRDAGGNGDGSLSAYESYVHAAGRMDDYYETPQCPFPALCRDFVLRTVNSVTLSEAFGIEGEGRSGGWFAVNDPEKGVVAHSGAILDEQVSRLEATVEGEGVLSFEWRVSSEAPGDVLSVEVDGQVMRSIAGEDRGWWSVALGIEGEGTHRVRWRYRKDDARSAGSDAGAIRRLDWTPGAAFLSPDEAAARLADPADDLPPTGDAATYVGYLCTSNGAPVGTLVIKTARMGRDGMQRTTVNTDVFSDGKRRKGMFSGHYDPAVREAQAISAKDGAPEIMLGRDSLAGTYGAFRIVGVCQGAHEGPAGAFPLAWPSSAGDGWNALSLALDRHGKAKYTGTRVDGTKVNASTYLLAGATNSCAVLVTAREALAVWFGAEGDRPVALGYPGLVVDGLGAPEGMCRLAVDSPDWPLDELFVAQGARWKVLGDNPARLRLSYNVRTGLFSGSFRGGAKVNGAVVDGRGYGAAVVRGQPATVKVSMQQ